MRTPQASAALRKSETCLRLKVTLRERVFPIKQTVEFFLSFKKGETFQDVLPQQKYSLCYSNLMFQHHPTF